MFFRKKSTSNNIINYGKMEENNINMGESKILITKGSFGWAIEKLKEGYKVARKGWNGKRMYITLIPCGNARFQGYNIQDCIGIKTVDNKMQPGWVASQNDILSEDWEVVEL